MGENNAYQYRNLSKHSIFAVMANFVLIALCMVAGMLFRASKTLPPDAHRGINAWIIYLSLPAISFKYLPYIQWSPNLLTAVAAPCVVWVGCWAVITLYAKIRQPGKKTVAKRPADVEQSFNQTPVLDNATKGGLRLVGGLANTSFVGFPLISAYFGEKYISVAIICDQVTFFLLSTAGVVVSINASKKHPLSLMVVVKRVLRFPPFLGCMGALIVPHFISIAPAVPLIDKLAATVAPLALFSIGLQLQFTGWLAELKNISVTLIYKLILAPLITLLIFLALGIKSDIADISIFEAAMPTLLTSGVVAEEYGLNPQLSNLIIGIGIVLSLITTGLWFLILRALH